MLRRDFEAILRRIQAGQTAELAVEAEGMTLRRIFRPAERLLLLGGGHIALPLCDLGAKLGFFVTVADDRAEFAAPERFPAARETLCGPFPESIDAFGVRETDYVCVITRGHRSDDVCLRTLFGCVQPKYLGMIGSRRRTSQMLEVYRRQGISPALLDAIHTPIGLSIGAVTPEEIAVAIAAELISVRRFKDADDCPDALENQDIPPAVLRRLSESTPAAAALVLRSHGSTPAKSGALMAVEADGRITGTIGGGLAEFEAAKAARAIVGTGQSRLLHFAMDNDVAAAEGMACGGAITVYISDMR